MHRLTSAVIIRYHPCARVSVDPASHLIRDAIQFLIMERTAAPVFFFAFSCSREIWTLPLAGTEAAEEVCPEPDDNRGCEVVLALAVSSCHCPCCQEAPLHEVRREQEDSRGREVVLAICSCHCRCCREAPLHCLFAAAALSSTVRSPKCRQVACFAHVFMVVVAASVFPHISVSLAQIVVTCTCMVWAWDTTRISTVTVNGHSAIVRS